MARPKILLVDNDEDFLRIATEFLVLNGYEVVTTTDLAKGRQLLDQGSFAVAFIDINFDVSDDHDRKGLALAIDSLGTSTIPKVILTAYGTPEFTREALLPRWGKTGAAVDFLGKQGGLHQMLETIEAIVQRARVFLSFADPDRAAVAELYHNLQMSGFLPWMDQMDLETGEIWRPTVERVIRKTDFVVVCVSRASIDHQGFYQSEIRMALEILHEQPLGQIFLIPARLEECEHPYLDAIHRVDLFSQGGYEKLVRALREGISRRGMRR